MIFQGVKLAMNLVIFFLNGNLQFTKDMKCYKRKI